MEARSVMDRTYRQPPDRVPSWPDGAAASGFADPSMRDIRSVRSAGGAERGVAGHASRRRPPTRRDRAGCRRLRLGRDRGPRSLAQSSRVRRARRAAAPPTPVPPPRAGRGPPPLDHARRHLLPGRRLARRRLPRRPRGLLLPAHLRHHGALAIGDDHVVAIEVACPPQRSHRGKRTITGVFQHWDGIDRTWNPGGLWRPVHVYDTGPVRVDRFSVLCRDADETRAHVLLSARLDSDGPRRVTLRTMVDGELAVRAANGGWRQGSTRSTGVSTSPTHGSGGHARSAINR